MKPALLDINDAYLVVIARAQKGRVVMLDTRLPVHGGGDDSVLVIPT